MSPLIWIQPANLGGLFFARNLPRAGKPTANDETVATNFVKTFDASDTCTSLSSSGCLSTGTAP